MNAQQRRRLKRIRQRQRESADRRLNWGDRQFVHTHAPSRVCLLSPAESLRFQVVTIGHRCTSTSHRHYTREQVDILKARGVVEWVGDHCKIARWSSEVHWENRNGAMQLLPGNSSKKGSNQHCQNMPSPSGFRGGFAVAMQNDGRID